MRQLLFCCLIWLIFGSCKKEQAPRVDIYLLNSFITQIDQTTNPPTQYITHAVIEDMPFITDRDIKFYTKNTATFQLRSNISHRLKQLGTGKAFAVTVDGHPVYYGKIHPSYLSSIVFGLATIEPVSTNGKELSIHFAETSENPLLKLNDRRNDSKLLTALKESGRLR
jgi:hypothetical protein